MVNSWEIYSIKAKGLSLSHHYMTIWCFYVKFIYGVYYQLLLNYLHLELKGIYRIIVRCPENLVSLKYIIILWDLLE